MQLTSKAKIPYMFAFENGGDLRLPPGETLVLSSAQYQTLLDNEGFKKLVENGDIVTQDDSISSITGENISADSDPTIEATSKPPATKR